MPKHIARGKSGGRKPIYSEKSKPTQANLYLPAGELEAFYKLVPATADRNKLVAEWIRAYTITEGKTNNLLAQPPLATELLTYLETTGAPKHLSDHLKYLIVQQTLNEGQVADGAVKTKEGV